MPGKRARTAHESTTGATQPGSDSTRRPRTNSTGSDSTRRPRTKLDGERLNPEGHTRRRCSTGSDSTRRDTHARGARRGATQPGGHALHSTGSDSTRRDTGSNSIPPTRSRCVHDPQRRTCRRYTYTNTWRTHTQEVLDGERHNPEGLTNASTGSDLTRPPGCGHTGARTTRPDHQNDTRAAAHRTHGMTRVP